MFDFKLFKSYKYYIIKKYEIFVAKIEEIN